MNHFTPIENHDELPPKLLASIVSVNSHLPEDLEMSNFLTELSMNQPIVRRVAPLSLARLKWRLSPLLAICALLLLTFSVFVYATPTAWAQIGKALAKVRSVRFAIVQKLLDKPAEKSTVSILGDTFARIDQADGSYFVMDIKKDRGLQVWPSKKQALLHERLLLPKDLNVLDKIAKMAEKSLPFENSSSDSEIPGLSDAKMLLVKDREKEYRLWVDADSMLPKRLESHQPKDKLAEQRVATERRIEEIVENFEYDIAFPQATFSMVPPEGFDLRTRKAFLESEPFRTFSDQELLDAAVLSASMDVMPGIGIGPIVFGMDPVDITLQIGVPDRVQPALSFDLPDGKKGEQGLQMTFRDLGFGLQFDSQDQLEGIRLYSDSQSTMVSRGMQPAQSFLGTMAGGLGINSSREQVLKSLGKPEFESIMNFPALPETKYEGMEPVQCLRYDKQGITLIMKTEMVVEIHLSLIRLKHTE